jgi:hypothetical protein
VNDALRWFGFSGISLIEYLANPRLDTVLVKGVCMAYNRVDTETPPATPISFGHPYSLLRTKQCAACENALFVDPAQTRSVSNKDKMRNANATNYNKNLTYLTTQPSSTFPMRVVPWYIPKSNVIDCSSQSSLPWEKLQDPTRGSETKTGNRSS